jgi:hypothetical protein
MTSNVPNSRRKTSYLRARREVQVQGKNKKARETRKDPRMINISNSVSIKKMFAISNLYPHLLMVQKGIIFL